MNEKRLQFEQALYETNLKSTKINSYNDIEKESKLCMCLQMNDTNYQNVYNFNNSCNDDYYKCQLRVHNNITILTSEKISVILLFVFVFD